MFASSIAVARVDIAAQSDLSLSDVLDRLGTYLANYSDQLSRTVANERYKQTSGAGNSYSEAQLESEFGIVKVPDYAGWLGFRDVLRVNGRAVQDHESRLQQLLLNPAPFPLDQARRIAEESAGRNIGLLQRNINNPAVVLELFDRRNRASFHFTKASEDTIDGTRVWVVRYEEQATPTRRRQTSGTGISLRAA